jgi:hypothetical protein
MPFVYEAWPRRRKIIQIEASHTKDDKNGRLYALCDDGTVWLYMWDDGPEEWCRLAPIPQPIENGNPKP